MTKGESGTQGRSSLDGSKNVTKLPNPLYSYAHCLYVCQGCLQRKKVYILEKSRNAKDSYN